MNIKGRVHYVSPKGSAEMVAEAIGREVRVVKEPLMPAYMPEAIALMFLGCEGGKADKVTLEFIASLNKNRVANAALFCCNPKKSTAPIEQMKAALEAQGINVVKHTFVCQGKGGLFGKHPTEEDLKAATEFADKAAEEVIAQ